MSIKFLVVDDATFIRDMVKKQLRDRVPGAEVFDAADGNRAVAQLKKQKVDIILSDWEMPGMSGEEFLHWVREQDDFKDTPFIMVTSRGDRDHVVKAVQAGVSDFITKPFSSDELIKKVFKQLKKIDKLPQVGKPKATTQGMPFSSVDALTGSSAPAAKPKPSAAAAAGIAALTGQSAPKSEAKPKSAVKPKPKVQGKAQLRFANVTVPCIIKDMSLQAMSGLMQRCDPLPTLFDQAVIDIETETGDEVARVNGYISSLSAMDNKVDSKIIKVTIVFVDNDPEKFEFLSRYIAKSR
jgi:CheY-like chemotaxis protein